HLHGIDAHVRALVFEFADRFAESSLQFSHLRRHQLWKPEQKWRGDPSPRQVFDDFLDVRRAWIAFAGSHHEITFAIYVRVSCAPVFDPVGFDCLFDRGGQLAVSRNAFLISIKPSETSVVTDFRPKMRRFLGWYA